MNKIKLIILTMSVLFFYSCKKEYDFELKSPTKLQIDEQLEFELVEKNNLPIDSISYTFDGQHINDGAQIILKQQRLGKHALSALVFYKGKTKKMTNTITLYADKEPVVYNYEVVNVYPHDAKAYTQGLEYHDGFLYESTGRKGQSSLRKVNLKDGKVLQKFDLEPAYFAEGMTILNDKIYQLTWQSKKGFVYNLSDFKRIKTFDYGKSKEGWGLCNDGKKLIKTDGTDKVWFLDPETLVETEFIESCSNKQSVSNLNELEYINGKIYANVWQKNILLIMNPKNGAIEGVVDLNGLIREMRKGQNLEPNDDVLNGIAYDADNDRLFVTGKHWGKLFEIRLKKRS